MVLEVGVVGGGVVGLTTATLLQEALTGQEAVRVTVVADKFLTDTTSDGAAGVFIPSLSLRGPTPHAAREWLIKSFKYYSEIAKSPEASAAGVKRLSGYILSATDPEYVQDPYLSVLTEHRILTPAEIKAIPGGWQYGSFVSTLLIENRLNMPYLMEKFKRRGGRVLDHRLESFEELVDQFDVVCNCSGLGARYLCQDANVMPVRGQIYQVIREWVGLRPYRPVVRVERELMTFPSGRTLQVVHNYGHGSYGVMSAPGTSMQAVSLVQEILSSHKAKL
ncbi:D-aspartate oxidase isoform X2 [Cherax quadricarinatus]|uniref:D-aspartate oxidase isoform X2 n=1 Tax=Cherax quadricarinatus TaxID=27406 RepID=UPI00387E88CD